MLQLPNPGDLSKYTGVRYQLRFHAKLARHVNCKQAIMATLTSNPHPQIWNPDSPLSVHDTALYREIFPPTWSGWQLLDPAPMPSTAGPPSRRPSTTTTTTNTTANSTLRTKAKTASQIHHETAEALHRVVVEEINSRYAHMWDPGAQCMQRLAAWAEDDLGRLAVRVLQSKAAGMVSGSGSGGGSAVGAGTSPKDKRLSRKSGLQQGQAHTPKGVTDQEQQLAVWTPEDARCWRAIATQTLGRLRTAQLFDIVAAWPSSRGAIEDLRAYLGNDNEDEHNPNGSSSSSSSSSRQQSARTAVVQQLQAALSSRLLHPGSSTSQILRFLIGLTHALAALEPSLVLLQRVCGPVRAYLRDREDTVRVIVTGLLSEGKGKKLEKSDDDDEDDDDDSDGEEDGVEQEEEEEDDKDEYGEVLRPLGEELLRDADRVDDERADLGEFDFDDMHWQPTPKDAPRGYKRSNKGVGPNGASNSTTDTTTTAPDVIGSLLSLYDSKDVFIGELQSQMGARLLHARSSPNTDRSGVGSREARLLAPLAARFGSAALQSCEVMVRDIAESAATDLALTGAGVAPDEGLHAKILSRLYWPGLMGGGSGNDKGEFRIPVQVKDALDVYAKGFAAYKRGRRLTWLKGLGEVRVVVQLEDRVVEARVHTWQAAVIYAFEGDAEDSSDTEYDEEDDHIMDKRPVVRTVTELLELLAMDETLLRQALTFWVGKLVLRGISRDRFVVVERMDRAFLASGLGQREAAIAEAEAAEAEDELVEVGVGGAETGEGGVLGGTSTAAGPGAGARVLRKKDERVAMYEQFVVSMLTNHGATELGRVAMMLKMVMPGLAMGLEEIREMVGEMVGEGMVEIVGGKYKMKG